MSFYERHILPHIIGCACASRPIMWYRDKVVPLAEGKVLELGAGGGLNFRFYDPRKVASVTGVDPSPELRAKAAKAERQSGLAVELADGEAESLPFADRSFDSVVCTFTLCSVRSPRAALAEARRVLRRGGRLLFAEHGRAPDPKVQRWQGRLEPVWKRIAGGCHLTRTPIEGVRGAGFSEEWLKSAYAPNTPRPLGWVEWGAALA